MNKSYYKDLFYHSSVAMAWKKVKACDLEKKNIDNKIYGHGLFFLFFKFVYTECTTYRRSKDKKYPI